METTQKKTSLLFVICILLIGTMLGSLCGELIKMSLPESVVKEVFLRSIGISVGPGTLNLIMFSITLGLTLKINLIGIVGLAIAYYLLRFWR